MGTYIPARPRKQRSVSDTLLEAEQEHYLDCPNADVLSRAAALLLDIILCTLASSAIHHFSSALATSIGSTPLLSPSAIDPSQWANQAQKVGLYLSWVLKVTVYYLYLIWAVQQYGGTPAKLLLGLRVLEDNSGEKLSYGSVLLREALLKPLSIASLVGCATALLRKDKRALHDLMSRSVVKKVRGGS